VEQRSRVPDSIRPSALRASEIFSTLVYTIKRNHQGRLRWLRFSLLAGHSGRACRTFLCCRRLCCSRVAFISHFYNDYYVFQYATSFTASSALSEKVLAVIPRATDRYLRFISSGKSKYPIELLQDARG